MTSLYIFDIDGTIANLEHRLHYINRESPDWDEFHEHVDLDKPIEPVITTLQMLSALSEIWFYTGRMESCRPKTEAWIREHVLITSPTIVMRRTGDFRPDYEVKQEMLDCMLDYDRQRLVAVFDDRKQIVDMWRRNGIQCFQVKDGDY